MARETLSLYDTTLRDGAQTHGVDFSLEDKLLIAEQLDRLVASVHTFLVPGPCVLLHVAQQF